MIKRKSIKTTHQKTSGFTLVEVLISMLLLGIVLTGGITFYTYSSEVMTLAIHKKMAMEIANEALERIREAGYDKLPEGTGAWMPEASVTLGNFSVQSRSKITDINMGSPTAKKQIEYEIRWTETGKQNTRTISLFTYLAKI